MSFEAESVRNEKLTLTKERGSTTDDFDAWEFGFDLLCCVIFGSYADGDCRICIRIEWEAERLGEARKPIRAADYDAGSLITGK